MSSEGYREKGLSHHGDECAVCGAPEDVIHHKDGDRSNNEISNLIPLCRACHNKVHSGNSENEVAEMLSRKLGKTPHNGEHTTIRMEQDLADDLHDMKSRGETYEDVIRRMMKEYGNGE